MSAEVRPTARMRPRSPSEAKARRRQWWHYALVGLCVVALGGVVWGGYAIWFSVAHVRASYARVSGWVVNLSPKTDTRVRHLLVRIGDRVKKGDIVAELDNADLEAQVGQAKANLAAAKSAQLRAEEDLEMTIRQTSASEAEAQAQLGAAQAQLAQAEAQWRMQSEQQPDQVNSAKANLRSAEANLALLKAGPRPQEIAQARADVSAAQAELEKASTSLVRMQKLQAQGAASGEQLESAVTDKRVAEANLTSAREKLSLLQAGNRSEDIDRAQQAVAAAQAALKLAQTNAVQGQVQAQEVATRAAERNQASAAVTSAVSAKRAIALKEQDVLAQRAAVAEAEAALRGAQVQLAESAIRSPVNGVIVRGPGTAVHEGEVVTKGSPIVTVVSTDAPLWINGSISELYADRVHKKQPVIIEMDAFRGETFKGEVTQVGGATEFSQGSADSPYMLQQVPIKIAFNPGSHDVKPGMSCRVWIDVQKR